MLLNVSVETIFEIFICKYENSRPDFSLIGLLRKCKITFNP